MPSDKYDCEAIPLRTHLLSQSDSFLKQTHFHRMRTTLDTMPLDGRSPTTRAVLLVNRRNAQSRLTYHMTCVSRPA